MRWLVASGSGSLPLGRARFIRLGLPHGYVAEKTNPGSLELKKCRPSLGKYEFCKALIKRNKTMHYSLKCIILKGIRYIFSIHPEHNQYHSQYD
jgi:hypothetical protein